MMKRKASVEQDDDAGPNKRPCAQTELLSSLTNILSEIRSIPAHGELSPELLETFKVVMLQIDELSADETDPEARLVKDESERCLETWLEDLVAQCEADGELFDDDDDDVDALDLTDDELVLVGLDPNDHVDEIVHHVSHLTDDDDDDEEINILDDDDPHQIQLMI
ncbi:hypothetical protein BC940DRAFT_291268 [Gongronella butleri]|nr:hypothetical protein BC940DRAFT_291268 [Gongronella butleri]